MEGLCYMHADSMALAQNRFETCAKLQPKSAAVAYQLSTLYAQNNDTINSIKQLKKAVKLNPNNYYYQTALAEIYSNQGKYKEAGNI
jgi:Tfp pilus assembly protein PilF